MATIMGVRRMALIVVVLAAAGPVAQHEPAKGLAIPESIRAEHEAIHSSLEAATKAPGEIGEAARSLAGVLDPHFRREEEIALPPLATLAPLAEGKLPPNPDAMLKMTDTLRRELPRMLEEHVRIRAAVERLRLAARTERNATHQQLAADLFQHARTEEEILYPAAILVGDVIRARQPKR